MTVIQKTEKWNSEDWPVEGRKRRAESYKVFQAFLRWPQTHFSFTVACVPWIFPQSVQLACGLAVAAYLGLASWGTTATEASVTDHLFEGIEPHPAS